MDRVISALGGSVSELQYMRTDACYFDLQDNRDSVELFDNIVAHRARVTLWHRYNDKLRAGESLKFLHLSDLHIPFHNVDVLNEAVGMALSLGVPYCIVNGDLLDVYAASKFAKNKSVEIRHELDIAFHVLTVLCEHFDEVLLVEGNHERRMKRYIESNIDLNLQWLFQVDLLDKLADQFDNAVYIGDSWLKIGSVIFAHPDNYSKVPGRTVLNLADSLRARGETISAAVIGHTHKIVNGTIANGMALYEAGCACHEMDYVAVGRSPVSPWTCGYGIIALDSHGDIDLNATRIYVSQSQPLSVIS